MKLLPNIVIGVVTVAVIAGFFIVGSPITERVRRFDERRVSDLQSIQWEVINYWQKKNQLPSGLEILRDDIRGYMSPVDPETGSAYEYAAQGSDSFSLCAIFAMKNNTNENIKPDILMGRIDLKKRSWVHDAGRVCFTRTIDKDLYQPFPMKPVPVIQ